MRGRAAIVILPLWLCLFGSALAERPLKTWSKALQQTEEVLRKDCGERCVEVLHKLVGAPELRNATDDSGESALNLLADRLTQQANDAEHFRQSFAKSTTATSSAKSHDKGKLLQPMMLNMKMILADTPCNAQTLCSIDALVANKCSFRRKAQQLSYQGLNVVVHVMAVLITMLCSCMYVIGAARCILSLIPPVCQRPYSVYSKAFSQSMGMWETVKASTKTCIIHGSPLISS